MGQNWRRNALRRLEYMVWTILTPEMVILWAARQWFGARDIANTDYGSGELYAIHESCQAVTSFELTL